MENKIPTVSRNVELGEKHVADLDEALSAAGIGWYNLKYCLVLALFLVAAIVEPVGYAYVLPASKCDLELSDAQRGFIASIPYIGIVIMSYVWGYLVDTQGRKRMVVYSSFGSAFLSILSAFMPEKISFAICKFLTSLCIAGPAAIPFTFIAEIIPQKYRDITLSVTNALQITGAALVPLFAWAILPLDFRINFGMYDFRPWRLLIIVNSLIFLISAILMSFGPESPKYLVGQGKHDEAMIVLQTIYAGNKGKSPDDYPVKSLKMPEMIQEKKGFLNSLKVQTLPLVKPPYLKWMALKGFLLFGLFATLNGLNVWVPDILNRLLSGSGTGLTACQIIAIRKNETTEISECVDTIDNNTYKINLIANVACAVIAVAGSATVKLIGKKALLVIVFWAIGIFCILVNFITNDMLTAIFLSSFPITGIGIGPINAFAVAKFPTNLRGMAISLIMMIGRLGSVAGTNVAAILLNINCQATFYTFGGLLILCGILSFTLPKAHPLVKKKPRMDSVVSIQQIDMTS